MRHARALVLTPQRPVAIVFGMRLYIMCVWVFRSAIQQLVLRRRLRIITMCPKLYKAHSNAQTPAHARAGDYIHSFPSPSAADGSTQSQSRQIRVVNFKNKLRNFYMSKCRSILLKLLRVELAIFTSKYFACHLRIN